MSDLMQMIALSRQAAKAARPDVALARKEPAPARDNGPDRAQDRQQDRFADHLADDNKLNVKSASPQQASQTVQPIRETISPKEQEKLQHVLKKIDNAIDQNQPETLKNLGAELQSLIAGLTDKSGLIDQLSDLSKSLQQSAPTAQSIAKISTLLEALPKLADGTVEFATNVAVNSVNSALPTTSQPLLNNSPAQAHELASQIDLSTKVASTLGEQSLRSQHQSTTLGQQTAPTEAKSDDPLAQLATLGNKLATAANQPANSTPTAPQITMLPDALAVQPTTVLSVNADGALVQVELSATGNQTQISTGAVAPRSFAGNLPGQINLPNLAFEMSRQFNNGNSRFEIRLDPPEMGRIDIRMDIDSAGTVTARLVVEKAETLDYLQRDARALERALAEAGLNGGETNLEFSLKDQNRGTDSDAQNDNGNWQSAANDDGEPQPAPSQVTHYSGLARPGGLNMIA